MKRRLRPPAAGAAAGAALRAAVLPEALDPEFSELFKVAADFDDRMPRSAENQRLLAQHLGTVARREGLKPLHRSAVARVIEESARYAGDAERLSAEVRRAADIVREADSFASQQGNDVIAAKFKVA